MRGVRNVAIILALAAVVAFIPGGGNATDTVLVALFMAFMVAITFAIYRFARQNELLLSSLTDTSRILLYGGLGMLALLVAGQDEMLGGSPGRQLLWILLLGAAVAAIWRVWVEATTYQ